MVGLNVSPKPSSQSTLKFVQNCSFICFCIFNQTAHNINVTCASQEFIDRPYVLVGNSIGSLACLMVSAASPAGRVAGTVLLNSAGAMNNKGVLGDWRIVLIYPIFLLIDLLLSIKPIAEFLFNR